jgi:hypothetical protein
MEGHEEGAKGAPAEHGNRGPHEIPAQHDAQHTDRQRCQVRIAGKPDRPQVPHLPMPLAQRHVVDRTLLDEHA